MSSVLPKQLDYLYLFHPLLFLPLVYGTQFDSQSIFQFHFDLVCMCVDRFVWNKIIDYHHKHRHYQHY